MRHLAHGKFWVTGAVLGTVLGGCVFLTTPAKFSATAVVELTAVSPTVDLGAIRGRPKLESVDTDARMLHSDAVVTAVAKASGDSSTWVRSSVGVSARPLTRVLEITYTSETPQGASAGANSAAEGLLDARQRLVIQPVDDYLSEVAKRTSIPLDAAVIDPDDRVGTAEFRVESWRERAITARLQLPNSGTVLQRANIATRSRGNLEVPLTSGAALGGLLGLALGIVAQWLRAGRSRSARRIQVVVRQAAGPMRPRTKAGTPAVGAAAMVLARRHPVLRGLTWTITLSLLGLALGYSAATKLDSRDTGRSTVLLRPLPGNAFSTRSGDTAVDLKTDGQVALSDAVLVPVVAVFHNGLTVESLRRGLSVRLVDNAEVVIISYKGGGAAQAIDVARRVAEQLLTVRTQRATAAFQDQTAVLKPELEAAEKRALLGVKGAIAGKKANREAESILNQRVTSLGNKLSDLEDPPTGSGSVLATTAPRQAGVRKVQLAIVAFSTMIATSIGLLVASREPRPRRRPGKGKPADPTMTAREFRAA